MQTQQEVLLDFLGQDQTQFTIPVYQRMYAWGANQCEELMVDIKRAGRQGTSHFMSMTLYLDAGMTPSGITQLDIIDGQQRIASMTILLAAFRDYLRETGTKLAGVSPETIQDRYLTVGQKDALETKVRLIGPDKMTLDAIILGTDLPPRVSAHVKRNHEYFRSLMDGDDFDPEVFWRGVNKLLIIAAQIDEHDKAQKIFEGLNTKGLPLTAADLIRNYLLVAETREEQQRLYIEYWQPMEIMFEDDILSSGSLKLNTGLRMWLAIRFKKMCISDRSRTYYYFKLYMEQEYDGTTEELLDELRSFCYLWAENYKCNEGRTHCSQFDWAKRGKQKTIVSPTGGGNALHAGDKGARKERAEAAAAIARAARSQTAKVSSNDVASLLPSFHRGLI